MSLTHVWAGMDVTVFKVTFVTFLFEFLIKCSQLNLGRFRTIQSSFQPVANQESDVKFCSFVMRSSFPLLLTYWSFFLSKQKTPSNCMEQNYFTIRHELPRTDIFASYSCFKLTLTMKKLSSVDPDSLCCFIFLGPHIQWMGCGKDKYCGVCAGRYWWCCAIEI